MPRTRDKKKQAKYKRAHYERNKEEYKKKSAESTRRYRKRNRKFVADYLSEHPCVDCEEDDPVVLDFDHVRGKKDRDVSTLVNRGCSIERIQKEIAKCEVRCANCHRRRTHRQRKRKQRKRV